MLRVQASGQASQQLAQQQDVLQRHQGWQRDRQHPSLWAPHPAAVAASTWTGGSRGTWLLLAGCAAAGPSSACSLTCSLAAVVSAQEETTISAFVVVCILRKMVQVFHAVTDVSLSKGAANPRGWGGMRAALSPCSSAASGFPLHVSLNILMSVFRARKSSLKGKLYPRSSD